MIADPTTRKFLIEDIRRATGTLNDDITAFQRQIDDRKMRVAELNAVLMKALPVSVGQEVSNVSGRGSIREIQRAGIRRHDEGGDSSRPTFIPYVDVQAAPATNKGFHATHLRPFRVWDTGESRYTQTELVSLGYVEGDTLQAILASNGS